MTERDVAAEVIKGLQEVREHRSGRRKLRETPVEGYTSVRTLPRDDRENPQEP